MLVEYLLATQTRKKPFKKVTVILVGTNAAPLRAPNKVTVVLALGSEKWG